MVNFFEKIFTLHNEINNKQMWERERFTFWWNVNNLERDVKTSGGKFDDFDEWINKWVYHHHQQDNIGEAKLLSFH